jgi:hypothetical protein
MMADAGNRDLITAAMSRLVMFAAMNAINRGSCRQRRYQRPHRRERAASAISRVAA